MSYIYLNANLSTIDDAGTDIRPALQYLPLPAASAREVSIGEKLRLKLTVRSTVALVAGQNFCFNVKLFSDPSNNPSSYPLGQGWKIAIRTGSGGLEAVATLQTASGPVNQNLSINTLALSVGDTQLEFNFDFFVTLDLQAWLDQNFKVTNFYRWLRNSPENERELDNRTASSFNRSVDSFIEIVMFECDKFLNPIFTPGDIIVRDSNNPALDTYSIPIKTKWFDEKIGGGSQWTGPTTKEDNYLKSLKITGGNLTDITNITHKGNPFESIGVIPNFDIVDSRLVSDVIMDVVAEVEVANAFNYDHLQAMLIRVDGTGTGVNFFEAYNTSLAFIPKAQPAAGPLGDGVFRTPSSFVAAGTTLTISFKIDGTKLDPAGVYHLILTPIEEQGDYSSSHISPQLTPTVANISLPASMVGNISTYNNTHANVNDLSVTNFERVKLGIDVDSTGYPLFDSELIKVRLTTSLATGGGVQSVLDRKLGGVTSGPVEIVESVALPIYTFEAVFRSFYNASAVPLASTHVWELVFAPSAFNQPDEVIIDFEQRLKHRKEDTTRLPNIQVLNYTDFIAATLTPQPYICTDDEKIVIETTKNGGANMNLIAMFIPAPLTSQPFEGIEEEESYASVFLTTLTSPVIESVDVSFTTQLDPDKAYYIIDTAFLVQGNTYTVEALCYDI